MDKNKEDMRPQDLRIGNYVRIKDNGKIVQVKSITRRNIGFHYKADKTLMYYRRLHEIEPVLISEMDGFLPYIKYLEWYDREDVDIYHYKGTPLTDLHQLQNIHYALTGNEIEIEI